MSIIIFWQQKKTWDAEFLVNDWTFAVKYPPHWFFNMLFGLLMRIFPMEIIAWVGLISCWSFVIAGFFIIGKKFSLGKGMMCASILLWLSYGQAIVGTGYIIEVFQTSCLSLTLIVLGLAAFTSRSDLIGAGLLGLLFSFHPSVGFFGILSVFLSILFRRPEGRRLLKICLMAGLFALPGLVPSIYMLLTGGVSSGEEYRLFSKIVLPQDNDS